MSNIPTNFGSLEELTEFVKGAKKKSSTRKKKGVKTPEAGDADTSVSLPPPEIPKEQIYKVIHYYLRPNDTFSALCREAKESASYHNNNVRTIVHEHDYTGTCTDTCRLITGTKED